MNGQPGPATAQAGTASLGGKTALVTGAATGIGKASPPRSRRQEPAWW
jgi:hypothetical protein